MKTYQPHRFLRSLPRWRWLNRVLAAALGYFWLPCPLCHRNFAGYEDGEARYMTSRHDGIMTCWRHGRNEGVDPFAAERRAAEARFLAAQRIHADDQCTHDDKPLTGEDG